MALTERMNERRVLTPQSFTCEGSYTLDYLVLMPYHAKYMVCSKCIAWLLQR